MKTTKTSPAHTAGRWQLACDSYGRVQHSRMACVFADLGIGKIATVASRIKNWDDARLIAAAPELLQACMDAVYALNQIPNTKLDPVVGGRHKTTYSVCSMLDALIAKAHGKAA